MWRRLLAFANLHTHRLVTLPEAIRNQVVTELVNDLVDRLRGLTKSPLPALFQSSIARTPRLGTNLLRLGIDLIAHLLCLLKQLFTLQLRLTEQTLHSEAERGRSEAFPGQGRQIQCVSRVSQSDQH